MRSGITFNYVYFLAIVGQKMNYRYPVQSLFEPLFEFPATEQFVVVSPRERNHILLNCNGVHAYKIFMLCHLICFLGLFCAQHDHPLRQSDIVFLAYCKKLDHRIFKGPPHHNSQRTQKLQPPFYLPSKVRIF